MIDGTTFYRSGDFRPDARAGSRPPPDWSRAFYVNEFEAIEVYRSAAELPIEFGGSAGQCGVIALWSRRGGPMVAGPPAPAAPVPAGPTDPSQFPLRRSVGGPWDLTVSIGWIFSGPTDAMEDYLNGQGWVSRESQSGFTFSAVMTRDLSSMLGFGAIFGTGSLGSLKADHDEYELSTTWSSTTIGPGLWLKPNRIMRLGGGPLFGIITRGTASPTPRNVILPGFFAEAAIKSTARAGLFLEGSIAYRMLANHGEGPWPVRNRRVHTVVESGQGPATAPTMRYRHAAVNVGVGWHF